MSWFSDPQRDSPEDIHAAHQALVHAGCSRPEAEAEFNASLYRVRVASASLRNSVLAGFFTGAAIAVALALVVVVSAGVAAAIGPGVPVATPGGPVVVRAAEDSGTADRPTSEPGDASRRSPLDILVAVATIEVLLGVAGIGVALVSRNRWRRAGALETFTDLDTERSALLPTLAVWVVVGALMVLAVRAQAGEQVVGGVVLVVAFVGVPLLANVFDRAFPILNQWFLPRISPLDAAAFLRPIIEREVALQIESERKTHGRATFHRAFYDRSTWADEVLARLDKSRTTRRRH
jgi:hypothetical protein